MRGVPIPIKDANTESRSYGGAAGKARPRRLRPPLPKTAPHSETPVSEDYQAIRSSHHRCTHSTGAVWRLRMVCCLISGQRSGCRRSCTQCDEGARPFQVKRS